MCLEKGKLESVFFSKIPADIPKMAISTLVAASAGGVVSLVGLPVAVGAGIILAVGLVSGIGLEYYDRKSGFSVKMSETVERMWKNLKEGSKNQEKLSMIPNLLDGLSIEHPFLRYPQAIRKGELYLYTA